MQHYSKTCLAIAAMAFCSTALSGDDYSVAEKRVFLDNHLKNLKPESVLIYSLHQVGKPDDSYDDSATMSVRAAKNGEKKVEVKYLSGPHKLELPEVSDAQGNPIVLYFLERDVRDMHRLVGGQEAYFRKRIRLALAEGGEVHPVTVNFNGRKIKADEVRILPYINDPLRSRFGEYYSKSYTFTISDQVPGGVYQIKTQVDNTKNIAPDAPPIAQTILTLKTPA